MKKTMAFFLSVMMLLGLLTACGEEMAPGSTNAPQQGVETAPGTQPQDTQPADDGLETVYVLAQRKRVQNGGEVVSNTMEYDENGNLIKQTAEYIYTYSYDAQNRMTGRTRLRKDGSVHQETKYEYDENGNEILQVEDYSEYHFEYASTYNAQGQLTQVVCTRNGEHFDTDTYTYDDQGRLAEYRDGTMRWFRYVYEGDTVTELSLNDNGTEDGTKIVSVYDDRGNLIREEEFEEGESDGYETYTYDENGKLLEECEYEYEDGAAVVDSKVIRVYNERGDLAEKKFYDGDQLEYSFVYEYTQLRVSPERAQVLRETNMEYFWQ